VNAVPLPLANTSTVAEVEQETLHPAKTMLDAPLSVCKANVVQQLVANFYTVVFTVWIARLARRAAAIPTVHRLVSKDSAAPRLMVSCLTAAAKQTCEKICDDPRRKNDAIIE
jgi:hypothetical protein